MLWGLSDLIMGPPKNGRVMIATGPGDVEGLRQRVSMFREKTSLVAAPKAGEVTLGRLDWWRLNRKALSTFIDHDEVADPTGGYGDITASKQGDCKQFAGTLAVKLNAYPIRMARCVHMGRGHLIALMFTPGGTLASDNWQGGRWRLLDDLKEGPYTDWEVETGDTYANWQTMVLSKP